MSSDFLTLLSLCPGQLWRLVYLGHFAYLLFALKRHVWIVASRPYPTDRLDCATLKGLNPEFAGAKQSTAVL